jgi:squalene-associated FAD-dependent desaturase
MDRAAARNRVRRVHVIGAGLAGLAAAVALARHGIAATLYEAGPAAGGRCRSYFDQTLGMRIDNGNHLLLSGNPAAMDYLETTGARATLVGPALPRFPFIDLASGERWTVAPGLGLVPWWIFDRRRRVPGTSARDYLSVRGRRPAGPATTVAEAYDRESVLFKRLLEPLAVAALNTPPEVALAALLRGVLEQTLLKGGRACLPCFPREGLSETFVDPALAWLEARGGRLLTGCRVAALRQEGGLVTALETSDGAIQVGPDEAAVLAVPPWTAAALLPGLVAPDEFQAIVNLHFRTVAEPTIAELGEAGFLGVLGGTAEWIFIRPGIVSVTISAANRLVDLPAAELAALVWPDVRAALRLSDSMPPVRVVKERRATFAATAAQERRRPGARWPAEAGGTQNLVLAGDWTRTGLPATIEGAIKSGRTAAAAIVAGT